MKEDFQTILTSTNELKKDFNQQLSTLHLYNQELLKVIQLENTKNKDFASKLAQENLINQKLSKKVTILKRNCEKLIQRGRSSLTFPPSFTHPLFHQQSSNKDINKKNNDSENNNMNTSLSTIKPTPIQQDSDSRIDIYSDLCSPYNNDKNIDNNLRSGQDDSMYDEIYSSSDINNQCNKPHSGGKSTECTDSGISEKGIEHGKSDKFNDSGKSNKCNDGDMVSENSFVRDLIGKVGDDHSKDKNDEVDVANRDDNDTNTIKKLNSKTDKNNELNNKITTLNNKNISTTKDQTVNNQKKIKNTSKSNIIDEIASVLGMKGVRGGSVHSGISQDDSSVMSRKGSCGSTLSDKKRLSNYAQLAVKRKKINKRSTVVVESVGGKGSGVANPSGNDGVEASDGSGNGDTSFNGYMSCDNDGSLNSSHLVAQSLNTFTTRRLSELMKGRKMMGAQSVEAGKADCGDVSKKKVVDGGNVNDKNIVNNDNGIVNNVNIDDNNNLNGDYNDDVNKHNVNDGGNNDENVHSDSSSSIDGEEEKDEEIEVDDDEQEEEEYCQQLTDNTPKHPANNPADNCISINFGSCSLLADNHSNELQSGNHSNHSSQSVISLTSPFKSVRKVSLSRDGSGDEEGGADSCKAAGFKQPQSYNLRTPKKYSTKSPSKPLKKNLFDSSPDKKTLGTKIEVSNAKNNDDRINCSKNFLNLKAVSVEKFEGNKKINNVNMEEGELVEEDEGEKRGYKEDNRNMDRRRRSGDVMQRCRDKKFRMEHRREEKRETNKYDSYRTLKKDERINRKGEKRRKYGRDIKKKPNNTAIKSFKEDLRRFQ